MARIERSDISALSIQTSTANMLRRLRQLMMSQSLLRLGHHLISQLSFISCFTIIVLISLFVRGLGLQKIEMCTPHNSEMRSKYLRAFSGSSSKLRHPVMSSVQPGSSSKLVYSVLIDLSLQDIQ